MPILRRLIGPLVLMVVTPILGTLLWMITAHFDGSILTFARLVSVDGLLRLFPWPTVRAALILAGWTFFQTALLAGLPGKEYLGPVTPTGNQPRYRLNGIAAWLVSHAAVLSTWWWGIWTATTVVRELGAMIVLLTVMAFAFCLFLYWKGRTRPTTSDFVVTGHVLFDFFQGIELHPTVGPLSMKQLINCRISMMGWSVLVLILTLYQYEARGTVANAMLVSSGLLILYLLKFFVWESGYFTSLDIMHDRFGYYICWGVLVWVPSVYTIFAQYLAHHAVSLHPLHAGAIAVTGLGALAVNYAADAQRQRVRATEGRTTVFGRPPRTLRASYQTSDGTLRENLLLTSGYWGWARHFHYVPEIVLALMWAIPAETQAYLPYFYVTFLTCLLVDRANRDDARCAQKYGNVWDEYRRLVPWKILPGVY